MEGSKGRRLCDRCSSGADSNTLTAHSTGLLRLTTHLLHHLWCAATGRPSLRSTADSVHPCCCCSLTGQLHSSSLRCMHRASVLFAVVVAATAQSNVGALLSLSAVFGMLISPVSSSTSSSSSPSIVRYRTPSGQRVQRSPPSSRQTAATSPSLSSLAAIRQQLQQLNQRIKFDPAASAAATALSLSLSPIAPCTPATPQSALSTDSFSSPSAYTDCTLPATSHSTDSSPVVVTLSTAASRCAFQASTTGPRYQSATVSTPPGSEQQADTANQSTAATHTSLTPSSHHDIYALAGPSPRVAVCAPPSVSSPSGVDWRREAKKAQRAAHALKAQCLQGQLHLMEERRRRQRLESREEEDERVRVERERAMADMRRDIEAMRLQVAQGRQQLEAELRAEYEEIVAAIMKEKDDVDEAAQQARLTHEATTRSLQQRIQQLSGQVSDSERISQQSAERAREAEARMTETDRQLQQYTVSARSSSQAQHCELLQRVAGSVLPVISALAHDCQQRMGDMEQRLVRVNTALQLVHSRLQSKQQLLHHLTLQHSDDTALLQRTIASITQHAAQHQHHVQRLTAEHDAYCAILRAQLEEERAKGDRADRAADDERAARRLDGERWERREAELRRDREELSAYYHNELDALIAEIEQLENDKEELSAAISHLHSSKSQSAPHALDTSTTAVAEQQDETASEWQQRARNMTDRMAAMQDEVRGMRDEINASRSLETDMRRTVAAIRRESRSRDEDKERQLDDMRALLQQMRLHYSAAAAAGRQDNNDGGGHNSGQTTKGGLLDESKEDGACDGRLNDSGVSSTSDDAENVEPHSATLQRVRSENHAMKREVAQERHKFAQLLKVRQFVQQHSEPSTRRVDNGERGM